MNTIARDTKAMAAMDDWIAASRDLQEQLLPLTARLQLTEAEALRGELDVLLGRQQHALDAALVEMATAADADQAAAIVGRLERRTFVALCTLWNHHTVRWYARRCSPGGAPWMPADARQVWRAVLIALIHDVALAQRSMRTLWPVRDDPGSRRATAQHRRSAAAADQAWRSARSEPAAG